MNDDKNNAIKDVHRADHQIRMGWHDGLEMALYNLGYLKNQIIGLAGPKGVGKTTFAMALEGKIFSLATPLKELLCQIVPKLYIYEDKESPIPGWPENITGRILLQKVGTECFRSMWQDIWVYHLMEQIEGEKGLCIVDDVRFPNEAEYIRSRGGQIWRLSRESHSPDTSDDHISEKGLPDELVDCEVALEEIGNGQG